MGENLANGMNDSGMGAKALPTNASGTIDSEARETAAEERNAEAKTNPYRLKGMTATTESAPAASHSRTGMEALPKYPHRNTPITASAARAMVVTICATVRCQARSGVRASCLPQPEISSITMLPTVPTAPVIAP